MKITSVLASPILAVTAAAADPSDAQIVSLVARYAGTSATLSVVVTGASAAAVATDEPIVVDLIVGDRVIGTLTVPAGASTSQAMVVSADVADGPLLCGRLRILGIDGYAGEVRPVPATPTAVN